LPLTRYKQRFGGRKEFRAVEIRQIFLHEPDEGSGRPGGAFLRTKAVFFPYWEIAARLVEDRAAMLPATLLCPSFGDYALCRVAGLTGPPGICARSGIL
jgi:hypothetical protein